MNILKASSAPPQVTPINGRAIELWLGINSEARILLKASSANSANEPCIIVHNHAVDTWRGFHKEVVIEDNFIRTIFIGTE